MCVDMGVHNFGKGGVHENGVHPVNPLATGLPLSVQYVFQTVIENVFFLSISASYVGAQQMIRDSLINLEIYLA